MKSKILNLRIDGQPTVLTVEPKLYAIFSKACGSDRDAKDRVKAYSRAGLLTRKAGDKLTNQLRDLIYKEVVKPELLVA